MNGTYIAVAATDFDGTLYRSDFTVSEKSLATLENLGRREILRVIVTGRSFFSLKNVIDDKKFPVDYFIVSSGSGIYSARTGELLHKTAIKSGDAERIRKFLSGLNCDFMIHEVLPDNHLFCFHRSGEVNIDFERRLDYYRDHGEELSEVTYDSSDVSQFLVIDKPGGSLYEIIKGNLASYTVIRTTSPLDHESSWIEIFPPGTDKGSALKRLSDMYGIGPEKVFAIGNDYNDLHMLDWAGSSFVVENAADPLKEKYRVVSSNNGDGFSEAVNIWLTEIGL